MNNYVVDCNVLRKNDRIRSEVDVFVVLESEYDAKCHASDVYFGSWKRTEEERDEALSQLAALREELARKDKVIEDMLESNGDMVQCLQSAEQSRHETHCVLLDPEEPSIECTCSRKIEQRLADADRRNAELEKDAARYQWLKECNGGSIGIVAWHQDEEKEMVLVEQYADEAIDAALNKPEEATS